MSYSNQFLRDFRPIFFAILKEKQIRMEQLELEVIDEEAEDYSVFEPADAKDVLEQIADDLNFLTIYTERPAYFLRFAETMYEENGLIVMIFPKSEFYVSIRAGKSGEKQKSEIRLVLDFEWKGSCYEGQMRPGRYYIPIHKRPWETAENLDIAVPIGYNTVIVKDMQKQEKKPGRDRFEEAFYNS